MSTVAGLPEEIRVKVPAGRANYYPHFKEVCEVLEQHLNEMKMHFDQRLDRCVSARLLLLLDYWYYYVVAAALLPLPRPPPPPQLPYSPRLLSDSIESQVSNLEQGLMLLGRDFLQSQPSSS